MRTVKKLAKEVERGFGEALAKLRKTVVKKLALAVGAMLEGQTANTVELVNLLPLDTARQDRREQRLRRLLKNPLLQSEGVMEPWAGEELATAARHAQTVLLSMDQTDLADRMVVLMVSVRVGDRSLLLAWIAEAGAANIEHPERLERLILIMTLAMYWCGRVSRDDVLHHPTPLEKNQRTDCPGLLELSEAPAQRGLGVLAQTGAASLDEVLAK